MRITVFSILFWLAVVYTVVISKLFPVAAPSLALSPNASPTYSLLWWGRWALAAISSDRYYCLLIPFTVPLTMLAIYVDWVGLKLFRHNS